MSPSAGRLDADVRVEPVLLERLERGDVRRRAIAWASDRLRDLLAEDVDRRELPCGVQLGDDAPRVGERRAGDVARGEALDDGAWDGRQRSDDRAVEQAHGAGA